MKYLICVVSVLSSLYSIGLDEIIIADIKGERIPTTFTHFVEKNNDSNILWIEKESYGNYVVMYNTNTPIAGFQFNLTGTNKNDRLFLSGGEAQKNGFSLSESDGLILGFSFTGALIPSGRGKLVELSMQNQKLKSKSISTPNLKKDETNKQIKGSKEIDITNIVVSDPYGNSVLIDYKCHKDECKDFRYSNYKYADKNDGVIHLEIASAGLNKWVMKYNSDVNIAGFQFDVEGAEVISSSEGAAGELGFMISASTRTIVSFSMTGDVIPAGSGTLLIFEVN